MNYHKFTLLLGAGFTKNFGGLLGEEMWAAIYNHPEIQKHPNLKQRMLGNYNYEDLYYQIAQLRNGASAQEAEAFKTSVYSAYAHLDMIVDGMDYSRLFWNTCLNELFIRFYPKVTDSKGFIFTLNQDLFFERNYWNKEMRMPGVVRNKPQFSSLGHPAYNYPLDKNYDYYELPDSKDLTEFPVETEFGVLNYIKLHGSINFRKWDGFNESQMIIGGAKKEAINKEPLLKEYFRIFEDVLNSEQTKLLVLGYSFRDQHVNEVLEKVIQKGVKIYVVDPSGLRTMKTNMSGNGASKVWENMSGYFPYKMLDLFGQNGKPTAAWTQLKNNYFGIE